uniref:Uncharacterized protein n=1 Tax=Nonomuraea gerenzanensis TaxID=93944 RepID=A0A1M4DZ34_9ACTN|nr:hypothetical protein BN4615_P1333 [Nonomuraea gerenzanensis]
MIRQLRINSGVPTVIAAETAGAPSDFPRGAPSSEGHCLPPMTEPPPTTPVEMVRWSMVLVPCGPRVKDAVGARARGRAAGGGAGLAQGAARVRRGLAVD